MAGLYVHIPFCKQACHYCDFHFSTSLRLKKPLVEAILLELELTKNYLAGEPLESIYFGGGTPTLLTINELESIFSKIYSIHAVEKGAEITLEANPDDLDFSKISGLRSTPVNRLSVGVQSFFDEDLRWMNRAHSARESLQSLELCQKMGFENLTVDLIYGSPTTDDARWKKNLETVFALGIPHLSSYALTVEKGTALSHFVKNGKSPAPDDERASRQFEMLVEATEGAGFEHYEISNFAKTGHRARHNSSYWLGKKYLGIGPSAHSFDGATRQWNVRSNPKYLAALAEGRMDCEKEILTPENRFNELILTRLRTAWGVEKTDIEKFGEPFLSQFLAKSQPFLASGDLLFDGQKFLLSKKGKLLADRISMELFV